MWHDDSQMTRDSFAEKAKVKIYSIMVCIYSMIIELTFEQGVLSGKKDKWNFPESQARPVLPVSPIQQFSMQDMQISGKPDPYPNSYDAYQRQNPYLPRRIAMESQGRGYRAAPPQNDIPRYRLPEHTFRGRQNGREQQLISSTPHNPQIQYAEPDIHYAEPDIQYTEHLPPTRVGTFEMPSRVEQDGNRDQYQAQNRSHEPQPDLGRGHYAPYSSPYATDDMINRAMGRVTHSSPYTTHIGVSRTHPTPQNTNTDNTLSNVYQEMSAAYLVRAHNKDGTAKDTKEDGPEGAPPKSNLSKNKMKALRPEVSSVDPVEVLKEEAGERYE